MRKTIVFGLFVLFFLSGNVEKLFLGEVYPQSGSSLYSSYLKGVLAEKYGDYQRALQEYRQASLLDRGSVSLSLRKAVQHIKLEEFQQAEKILKKVKKSDPVNLDASLLLVFLYTHQDQEDKAIKEYGSMLGRMYKENPENLNIAQDLARYKIQAKDYDTAVELYEKIIELEPRNSDAHFWLGYVYEEQGNRRYAIKEWEKTLHIDPDYVDALNALGYTYAEEGIHLDRAEKLIKRALGMRPGIAAYLDSLGWVYFKKGNFLEAKKYIKKAADKSQDPIILEHLGQIYYELGELKKAEEVWKKVIKIKPDSEQIKKRLEKIGYELSTK